MQNTSESSACTAATAACNFVCARRLHSSSVLARPSAAPGCGSTGLGDHRFGESEQKHVEPHLGAAPPMQRPNTVKHRPAFGGTAFGCLTRPSAAPGCGSTGLGCSRPARTLAPDLIRPSAAPGCGSTGLGSSRWRRLGLERLLQNTRRAGARDAPARAFGVARTMLWASSCGPCGAVNYFTTLAVLMVPSA